MSRVFITGSSDGLGLLAAQKLIAQGHQVVLHARNEERAKVALDKATSAEAVLIGDLSDINETRQLASRVNELGTFDAVIHNAGILHVEDKATSKDGVPLLFAVNTLAPYILTALINHPQRIVYTSSSMHRQGDASVVKLEDMVEEKAFPSYSDTKLHDLLLALAVQRKWPDVVSNAVDPGWVPTKMGGTGAPDDLHKGYETQIWLATSTDKGALQSGRLLFHQKEVEFHPQAKDIAIQNKLLSVCEKISGVKI